MAGEEVIDRVAVEVVAELDKADRELRHGLDGAFAVVEREANATAGQIERDFEAAARGADRALRDIGGVTAFAPVVAEARVAAAAVEHEFGDIDVDIDRHGGFRSMLGRLTGGIGGALAAAFRPDPALAADLGEVLPGMLASVVGSPAGVALAGALVAAAAPLIITGLALGVGAGLLGLGAVALRNSEPLKQAMRDTGASISSSLQRAAQPLEGAFLQALLTLQGAVQRLEPYLSRMFAALAPVVPVLAEALADMAINTMPGLLAAMPGVVAAFSELAEHLPMLGALLGELFRLIGDNEAVIRQTITAVFIFADALVAVLAGALTVAGRYLTIQRQAFDALAGGVSGAMARIVAVVQWMSALLRGILGALSAYLQTTWAVIVAVASGAWTQLRAVTGAAWAAIRGVVAGAAGAIAAVVRGLLDALRGAWTAGWLIIRNQTAGAWVAIRSVVANGAAAVRGLVNGLAVAVAGIWQATWGSVRAVASGAWAAIRGIVAAGVAGVLGALRPIAGVAGVVRSAFAAAADGARAAIGGLVSAAASIPGRVVAAVGNLGGLLYNAGRSVIQGLISGITSMFGPLGGVASRAAGIIAGALPHSPAEYGPLSGSGSPEASGRAIADQLARGMTSGARELAAAARQAAGVVAATTTGPGGPGRGWQVENMNVSVAPVTGRFSLREVFEELTWQQRQLYLATVH